MVAKEMPTKERIVAPLDALPEEALTEIASFVEFQRSKVEQQAQERQRPTPVKFGGLWEGVTITDDDIAEARREMWGRYMDDEQ